MKLSFDYEVGKLDRILLIYFSSSNRLDHLRLYLKTIKIQFNEPPHPHLRKFSVCEVRVKIQKSCV